MIPFRTALSILSLSIVLAACQNTPTPVGIGTRGEGATRIMERAPIDIAVLPVVNNAGALVPTNVLRESFQQGLVDRRYSPLSLEYVDRNVTEASYNPGSSQEQAVCTIQVDRWDTNYWKTHNALVAGLSVTITDALNGDTLWKGTVEQRFDLGPHIENLPTETMRIQKTCEILAAEVLQKLPLREPRRPGDS